MFKSPLCLSAPFSPASPNRVMDKAENNNLRCFEQTLVIEYRCLISKFYMILKGQVNQVVLTSHALRARR